MAMQERPAVTKIEGGKTWQHSFDSFSLKSYVPDSTIRGAVHNYTFRMPLLLVFEENPQTMEEAVAFARKTGLDKIASAVDSSVFFIYPTCEGGWKNAPQSMFADIIAEVKMNPEYEDGICSVTDFFSRKFEGYFARGAIFRADIYSYGASADYVATNLLTTLEGQYLWGPGEITPAMCSMERLSVVPKMDRKDIAILSVGNSEEVNAAFADCEYFLKKDAADYPADFKAFVHKFKRWCGVMEIEPDFEELGMVEETGSVIVPTSEFHLGAFKDKPEHEVGYFAYYNKDTFDNGPAPLLLAFHGGGDSTMFLTFVSGWWQVCHKYGFLYVAIENHQNVCAEEAIAVLEDVKKKYNVDTSRIYATGFSMGCGKTWDLYMEYPEVFAGVCPGSALFPVKNNPFSRPYGDWINTTVPVPMFYSGGESSFLPELPSQDATALERIKYLAGTNQLKACDKFQALSYDEKDSWEDKFFGVAPDRVEKINDPVRGSVLTIRYYDSTDGVCRTALGSIDNQVHEYRHHTCENAWLFISQFHR